MGGKSAKGGKVVFSVLYRTARHINTPNSFVFTVKILEDEGINSV